MILDNNFIKHNMVVIITRQKTANEEIFRLGKILTYTTDNIILTPYKEDDLVYLLGLTQDSEQIKLLSIQYLTIIPVSEIKEIQIIKN